MKIIVGLGNPGEQYSETRHNAGFMFVDALAGDARLAPVGESLTFRFEEKFEALIASTEMNGEKVILAKPQTFMNLSGKTVSKILSFYKVMPEELIVVSDDVDLPIGTVRVRRDGSSGGQKGLQNVIDSLQNNEFTRIRIGIRSDNGNVDIAAMPSDRLDTADYVLSKFSKREAAMLPEVISMVIDYIVPYIGGKEEIPAHTLEVRNDSL